MAAKKGSGKKAKTSKTTVVKQSAATTTTTAQVPAPTVTPAPVEVAAAPVVTPTEVSTTETTVLTHSDIESQFAALNEKLSQLRSLEVSIVADMKRLQKVTTKYIKSLNKKNKKTSTGGEKKKRAPSGFAKPTEITPELCAFLNVEKGTEMARTEVTKKLTAYIKEHGLQDNDNKRIIIPDTKLNTLLGNPTEQVTYFNLQKYMKVHFPKKATSTGSSSVSTSL